MRKLRKRTHLVLEDAVMVGMKGEPIMNFEEMHKIQNPEPIKIPAKEGVNKPIFFFFLFLQPHLRHMEDPGYR